MAGGQQIDSAHGVMVVSSGPIDVAAAGSESTAAVGTTAPTAIIGLRSRKTGSGSAAPFLTGQASSTGTGIVVWVRGIVLAGQGITSGQGTVTYRGLALLNWNANSETDVAYYSVSHGFAPNVWDFEADIGLVTSYQMANLAPGLTHYFSVSATDSSGNESQNNPIVSKAY